MRVTVSGINFEAVDKDAHCITTKEKKARALRGKNVTLPECFFLKNIPFSIKRWWWRVRKSVNNVCDDDFIWRRGSIFYLSVFPIPSFPLVREFFIEQGVTETPKDKRDQREARSRLIRQRDTQRYNRFWNRHAIHSHNFFTRVNAEECNANATNLTRINPDILQVSHITFLNKPWRIQV